jgi:hypothetical protein
MPTVVPICSTRPARSMTMRSASVIASTWSWVVRRGVDGLRRSLGRYHCRPTRADQLFLDSIREDAIADAGIRQAAMANTMDI